MENIYDNFGEEFIIRVERRDITEEILHPEISIDCEKYPYLTFAEMEEGFKTIKAELEESLDIDEFAIVDFYKENEDGEIEYEIKKTEYVHNKEYNENVAGCLYAECQDISTIKDDHFLQICNLCGFVLAGEKTTEKYFLDKSLDDFLDNREFLRYYKKVATAEEVKKKGLQNIINEVINDKSYNWNSVESTYVEKL